MAGLKGLDRLVRKLDALGGNSQKALAAGMIRAVKQVQGDAKDLCPVNDGQLRNSILGEVEERHGAIVGAVSTNARHAPYVEFGTGPRGEASPKDLPPDLVGKIQYKQDGWWIHESQIDAATAEKYHFFRWEAPDGQVFYRSEGQPAHPFLYPALKKNEDFVRTAVAESLKTEIAKLAGGGA